MGTRAREGRARAAGEALLYLAAALLAIGVLGCIAHDTFRLWSAGHADTARNVLNCIAYVAAGLVVLLRGALRRGERAGWIVLGCGLLVYAGGWIVFEFGYGGLAPSPSWADAPWLGSYLGFYAGVILLGRARPTARRPRSWLDGGLTGLTLAAFVAATALQAVLHSRAHGIGIAVAAAYPAADIALLTGLGATFAARDWRLSPSGRLLGVGALVFVSADTVYTIASIDGSYHAGVAYDPAWAVAVSLVAAAAWASTEPPRRAEGRADTPLVVPCLAALAALGLLVFAAGRGGLNPVAYGLAAAALAFALVRLVLTLRDVAALAESRRLSLTDDLTGLPNRRSFTASLQAALERGEQAALLMIDLDGFKELNDTLGHPVGDELLQGVGARLAGCLRGGDIVARLGGDEFAVLLHRASEREAVLVAERMREALGRPLPLAGMSLFVGASLGIAIAPDHATECVGLLRHADVAMYEAKHSRAGIAVSSPGGGDPSRERLALAGELRGALRRGELELLYQPLADLRDGRVRGAEALIRWRHPARGMLTPDVFLPALELTDLMRDLTRFVLESAIRQAAVWRAGRGRIEGISVNLSATDLLDLDLPDRVAALLDGHGLEPPRLTIEITESAFITDPQRATAVLEALRARGVRIALDDFGTGYSSLTHLQRLPADAVKIDRSFVAAMREDERAAAIVASTIDLAHALGLTVVAEGVEDAELWRRLRAAGCDAAQGWFLARALGAAELEGELPAIEARVRSGGSAEPLVS